jgi:hypothetical protein
MNSLRCKHCRKTFHSNRSNQVFCSPACRINHASDKVKATRTKRATQRQEKLGLSNFGTYLINACQHAETVEILNGHSPESLLELLKLTKQRTSYSGMADGSVKQVYELSHIHPVKGVKKQIGLLHPANLVIAPKDFNRSRRTNYTAGGLFLAKAQREFKCSTDTPPAKVQALIAKYLGDSLSDFLARAKLTKSTRNQQIARLVKIKAKEAPAPSAKELIVYESQLKRLSKAALAEAVEASGAKIWTGDRNTAPVVLVALIELKRLQPDSCLVKVLSHLETNLPGFESGATTLGLDCTDQSACLSFVLEQCWRCLHNDKYSLIYNDRHLLELLIDAVEIEGGSWF